MEKILQSIFGSSWKTSLMGLAGGVFYYFSQAGTTFPTDATGWKTAIVSAGIFAWGRMQKDSNVSNAPVPSSMATVVK